MTNPRRPHPHFDDRGALDWNTSWAQAQAEARAARKMIFIEFGREQCGNCRALVQGVVPHGEIAPLLERHFVALASDCDEPEDAVLALADHLSDATMLPFAILADAEGNYLGGSEGAQSASSFKALLQRVIGSVSERP